MIVELGIADHQQPLEMPRPLSRFLEGGQLLAVDDGHGRPGVAIEVPDRLWLEMRVDHDYDRADLENTKKRGDELGSVR